MVERKLRPAPSTLHLLPSRKPAKPGGALRDEAVRARHQRADARSDEPVPVRGARHLPADPHARGARQQQEGRDRSRAQRAAGVALPRRARHRARRDRTRASPKGIPLDEKSSGAATGRLYLQTETIATALPPSLANGKADNQILAVVMHLAQLHPKRNVDPGVEGHQHADQGARARHGRRGLLQRQGARGHRAPLQRHARAAGGLLGPARQGHGVVAAGRPHATTA